MRRALLALVVPVAVLAAPPGLSGQTPLDDYTPVTRQMLESPPAEEWLMWRRTFDHQAFSPLSQIDRTNVADLRLAWAWTMERGFQETTPLVHDGVMFLAQSCDFVEAIDARDGTPLWSFRRPRVENPASYACVNRTAALYDDKLFIGTQEASLLALDVHTGEIVWEEHVGEWEVGHHYSGGPMVIDGMIVAGMSGCYYINSRCFVSAHDPDTGAERWRTYTIAYDGEAGGDSWAGIPDELRTGGSAWIAPSYDPELGLIFVGVAVPVPWGAIQRKTGDEEVLYTNSTLALEAATGEIAWHFQHLPGDEWDQDHPYERIVVETEVAPSRGAVDWIHPDLVPGERRKVVTGVPGKPGIVWTLDAATGDFLWAKQTVFQNVIVGVDHEGRRGIPNPELKNPEIGQELLVCPHLTGGINWQAVAYSPLTNALYVPTNATCMQYSLNEVEPTRGMYHDSAEFRRIHIPDSDGQVGRLTAVDVATGRTLWTHVQRAGVGGSVLTTGGGLVFVTDDRRRFRAFDQESGEVLWEQTLNSSAGGYPITYMVDGVQYVAIPAGGGPNYRNLTPEIQQRPGGNTLFVFRLPG